MITHPLNRVPVELKFGHDGGGKVDATGAKLGIRCRLLTALLQKFK
jgi:hypothetical protein